MGISFSKKKNMYKNYFCNSNELLCIINNNGKFININDKFINKLGYTRVQIYNKIFNDFIHNDDLDISLKHFREAKNGEIICCRNRFLIKNNDYILLEWTCVKDKYTNNILCIAKDVTIENKLQEEILFYKDLLLYSEELALCGSWSYDIDNNKLILTDSLKKIYNIEDTTFELYISKNHPDEIDFIKTTMNKCIENKLPYEFKHRIIVDNNIKHVFSRGKYIIKDNVSYIQGVLQDITKQHYIEESLRDAKIIAEKASEMKSSFVANMSHEIRTPINGIIGSISLLKDRNLDKDTRDCLEIISYSSGLLLSIINNVLDFSKIEAGIVDMEFNNIFLKDFISSIINSFKHTLPENIKLIMYIYPNVPSSISTDRMKLRQIITNLISNALKFTSDGLISIIVSNEGSSIIFEIKDTGIGIKKEIISNLFTPFVQGDSTTTRVYGGTGLGLSICKKLVELLDGEIKLTSSVNIGTSIIFSIKNKYNSIKMNEPMTLPILVKDNNSCVEGKQIVVVEDNKINQIIMRKTLEKLNYNNYIIYKNGKELLDNIHLLNKASLFLMDIHMPIMDGYKTSIMLRENGIKCPIIALTANALSGEKEKCINIGMNDFLLKPISLNDLKICIEKWIK